MSGDCLSDELLERYCRGELSGAPAEAAAGHLAGCQTCRQRLRAQQETVELLDDIRLVVDREAAQPGADPFARRHARGTRVGPYEIQDLLGTGGMARVYRAVHVRTGEVVALKLLKDEHQGSGEIRARFLREARATARLDHPNVLRVFPPEEDAGGGPFTGIAMELLAGGSLAERIAAQRREGSLPEPDRVLALSLQAARGLGAAHSHGLVHRDIKPSNLLLDEHGCLKVSDFGVVQALESTTWITGTGHQIGTPAYMSPEQCKGEKCTPASDVYSLGVTMFELATNRLPFTVEGGSPFAQMLKHISERAPDPVRYHPQLPDRFASVILRCLEKDPADRFCDGDALSAALDLASRGEEPSAPRAAGEGRKTPWQMNAPIIREQLERLPQRSIVAWACRCARRVQGFNNDPRVEQAIAMAESVAAGADRASDRPASSRILARMQKLRAASLAAAYTDADDTTEAAAVAAARAAAAASACASARCAADAAADAVFALENALLAWRAGGHSSRNLWREAQNDYRTLRAARLGASGTIGLAVPTETWKPRP